jgi:hypothetical protein
LEILWQTLAIVDMKQVEHGCPFSAIGLHLSTLAHLTTISSSHLPK